MNSYSCKNISKKFSNNWIFRHLDLQIQREDRIFLSGNNGAGKTTLMKTIAGILKPSEGSITRPNWQISVIGQSPMLYKHLSCLENIELFCSADQTEIKNALDAVSLLMHRKRPLAEFSKGMIQRTQIALALLRKPDFLFLDEPFTALDKEGMSYFIDVLQNYAAIKAGFLLIDHDQARGKSLTSRHLNIQNARLQEQ